MNGYVEVVALTGENGGFAPSEFRAVAQSPDLSPSYDQADDWLACPHCDLLYRQIPLAGGSKAVCRRCGLVLYRCRERGVEFALALSIAGLMLFIVANFAPLLALEKGGLIQETTLWSGIGVFVERGEWLLALLVLGTLIIFPLVRLAGLVYVLYPLHRGRSAAGLARVFRLIHAASPWSMLEIFLLGALVAAVKLGNMATVMPGVAAYAFVGLILVSAWAEYLVEPRDIWRRIDGHG